MVVLFLDRSQPHPYSKNPAVSAAGQCSFGLWLRFGEEFSAGLDDPLRPLGQFLF